MSHKKPSRPPSKAAPSTLAPMASPPPGSQKRPAETTAAAGRQKNLGPKQKGSR